MPLDRLPDAARRTILALPVAEALDRLLQALTHERAAVLLAPPGAGKTTVVPLALLDADWLDGQRVVMLEPRRLAARASATRMADLLGEAPGERVGFRTRLDSAVSSRTRIEVVTEGLLVRRLLADPTLDGVGCVVFDEIHERSLDGDLALAFGLDLQRTLRPELRLLAMSATIDGAALSHRVGGPVVESRGRMFPVEIRHARRDLGTPRDLPEAMARGVRAALAEPDHVEGDVLAFLPGVGEIRRTAALLDGLDADVVVLFGEMPAAEQDRVLRPAAPGCRRRVVLATSIAETSLTVPGVRIVVDGGFRRVPRLDAGSGLPRLETLRVSRAAAAQRAGRAGRLGPGLTLRLWSETLGRGLAAHDRPEILDADLAGFCLAAASWQEVMGTEPQSLPLPDPPGAGAQEAARGLLRELGALDAAGRVTGLGRRMAELGAHPRLAAMMLQAANPAEAALAARLAALLEERDPLRPRPGTAGPRPPCDLSLRLAALDGASAWPTDRAALTRIRQAASLYRRRLGVEAAAAGDAAALLAAAFPDRVAQRREPGSFRLSGGGSARLARDDPFAAEPLLAAAGLHLRTSAEITLALPLDPEALPPVLLARTTEQVESSLDTGSRAVVTRSRLRLGALVLRDRSLAAEAADVAGLLAAEAARDLRRALHWSPAACQLQARVACARALALSPTLPDLSDAALAGSVADWLQPALAEATRLADLATLDLARLLRQRLDPADRRLLDRALPEQLVLPGGRAEIDYTGPVPQAAARAQAFYGLRETPRLADGRLPLRLALLSPAGRPAAITGDIAVFWRGGWAETRTALRGRYPKHHWPEDPLA